MNSHALKHKSLPQSHRRYPGSRVTMLVSLLVFGLYDHAVAQTEVNDAVMRLMLERSLSCVSDSFAELRRCQNASNEIKSKLQTAMASAARSQLTNLPPVNSAAARKQVATLLADLEVIGSPAGASAHEFSTTVSRLVTSQSGTEELRRSISQAIGVPTNEQQAQQLLMTKVASLLGSDVGAAVLNPAGVAKERVRQAIDRSLRSYIDSNLKGIGRLAVHTAAGTASAGEVHNPVAPGTHLLRGSDHAIWHGAGRGHCGCQG